MAKTPSYQDMYGGKYVNPDDLKGKGRIKLKIIAVEAIELFCPGAGKNWKVVFSCAGAKKKVAVNKTSAKKFVKLWGEDYMKWCHHDITVEHGVVNGKPAVLCSPIKGDAAAPSTAETNNPSPIDDETPEPGATDGPVDDLEIPEDQIPK